MNDCGNDMHTAQYNTQFEKKHIYKYPSPT